VQLTEGASGTDSRGGLWITGWNSGDLRRHDSDTNSWGRIRSMLGVAPISTALPATAPPAFTPLRDLHRAARARRDFPGAPALTGDQVRSNRRSTRSSRRLTYVVEFQFCYYNRENRNIFGEAMRGC
jgi:hypothetical protein